MLKGCLARLVFLCSVLAAEWVFLPEHLHSNGLLAVVLLALLVTLAAGSLLALWDAIVRLRLSQKSPQQWRDGDFVMVSGELRPLRESLRAPASQREVAMYQFQLFRPREPGTHSPFLTKYKERIDLGSMVMVPCAVYTQFGPVRLVGFPTLTRFPTQTYEGSVERKNAAIHMASQEWQRQTPSLRSAVGDVLAMYDSNAPAAQYHHMSPLCNLPLVVAGQGSGAGNRRQQDEVQDLALRLQRLLKQQRAQLKETVVEPGAVVTAFGHYNASAGAVDVGDGLRQWKRTLEPGDFLRVSRAGLRSAAITTAVFGTLAWMAHQSIYFGEARWLLWLADLIGS